MPARSSLLRSEALGAAKVDFYGRAIELIAGSEFKRQEEEDI